MCEGEGQAKGEGECGGYGQGDGEGGDEVKGVWDENEGNFVD